MRILLGILLILFFWIAIEYLNLMVKRYQIELKKAWFTEENARLLSSNRELEKQYEYFKTDYFFRKEAKRKLNKKEVGEKVIILSASPTQGNIRDQDSNQQQTPLQKWWEYIFGI